MRGGFESVFFFYTFRADLFQRDRAETEKGRYCHDIGTISLFPVLRSLKILICLVTLSHSSVATV